MKSSGNVLVVALLQLVMKALQIFMYSYASEEIVAAVGSLISYYLLCVA